MRVLLVNLPPDPRETMFPLPLAGIAAVLKAQGYQVEGFDFGLRRRAASWPAAAEAVDVVLWTVCPQTWGRARKRLAELEPNEHRLVIVAGAMATLFPDQVLAEPAVDAAVLGEAEQAAADVIRCRQSGDRSAIPGVVWQRRWTERGFVSSRDFRRIEQLGELPPADRTVFRVDDYTGMATRRARYTQIVATRGSGRSDARSALARLLPGGRTARPVEQVVQEMAALRKRFGIDEFHFEDDGLLEDPDYAAELCGQIRRRLPGVLWQCPNGNHPDDLRVEMIEDLAAAGCYRVYLQLDGPDPAAMQLLRRPWEPARLGPLTAESRRVGLELGGYFTLGLPHQSPQQMQSTVRFAVESGLVWAQFTRFRFIPGSELFQRRDELSPGLPGQRHVRRAIRRAYRRFYGSQGRWRVVLRNLNRRNVAQLLRRTYDKLLLGRPER